jgi:hypothetical protein
VLRGSSLPATCLALASGALLLAAPARGEPGRDVASIFYVAKSENRNQVHYGVHLDSACAPAGPDPVYAYWRMLEHGPLATEPLLSREVGAYGFVEQHVIERGPAGGRTVVRLHALPGRPITITASSHDGRCEAVATAVIGGMPASVANVFAQLKWPFGVDYLVLRGRALADGRALQERLSD